MGRDEEDVLSASSIKRQSAAGYQSDEQTVRLAPGRQHQ